MAKEACAYCGKQFSETVRQRRDHIIPKALGGNNGSANLVPACEQCNSLKNNHTPASLRQVALDVARRSQRLYDIADRVEALMIERGLSIGAEG
jgi:5-methylcytosine-specific restriction endonuclease McrA